MPSSSIITGNHHKKQLIELATIAFIIILLTIFAATAISRLFPTSERQILHQTIEAIELSLRGLFAESVVSGNYQQLYRLQGSNPVELLVRPPTNYLGEIERPNPAMIEGPAWYFDKSTRLLVYRPISESNIKTSLNGPVRIRLGIDVDRLNGRSKKIASISLQSPDDYTWVDN